MRESDIDDHEEGRDPVDRFCVEHGDRKATHLHGTNKGLEPCCGQHGDCAEFDDDFDSAYEVAKDLIDERRGE